MLQEVITWWRWPLLEMCGRMIVCDEEPSESHYY
jgi:hypothetical protein